MRIEEFKSTFKNGARPTLYRVEAGGLPEKFRFLAKTAQIPGKNIGVIEVPYMGQKIKVAGDATFDDLSFTIILDEDFSVRNELENLMELAKANDSAEGAEMAEYKFDLTVVQMSRKGEEIAQYKAIGCVVSTMSAIELGFENTDQIAEYTVTFAIDYWTREV